MKKIVTLFLFIAIVMSSCDKLEQPIECGRFKTYFAIDGKCYAVIEIDAILYVGNATCDEGYFPDQPTKVCRKNLVLLDNFLDDNRG